MQMPDRFWSKVDVRGPDECWPWTAGMFRNGYGQFAGSTAHRTSYLLSTGIDPTGKVVCHKCDNPICCNPGHLFTGTHRDNVNDKVSKNRQSLGEMHGRSRITEATAIKIISAFEHGAQLNDVRSEFGVSKSHACNIKHGKAWRHIPRATA